MRSSRGIQGRSWFVLPSVFGDFGFNFIPLYLCKLAAALVAFVAGDGYFVLVVLPLARFDAEVFQIR